MKVLACVLCLCVQVSVVCLLCLESSLVVFCLLFYSSIRVSSSLAARACAQRSA